MVSSNLKQFNQEIDAFGKTVPDKITTIQKKVVFEALSRLVMKTPVDTGRARGNWQVSIASPAESALQAFDKTGGDTIQKGLSALAYLPPYMLVWISNNVDYIEFLEDGHSKQAPSGMLALTVEELKMMFSKATE